MVLGAGVSKQGKGVVMLQLRLMTYLCTWTGFLIAGLGVGRTSLTGTTIHGFLGLNPGPFLLSSSAGRGAGSELSPFSPLAIN